MVRHGPARCSSLRPIEDEFDTTLGLLGGSGLGNALNVLLNGIAAGPLAKYGTPPSCRLIHVVNHSYP